MQVQVEHHPRHAPGLRLKLYKVRGQGAYFVDGLHGLETGRVAVEDTQGQWMYFEPDQIRNVLGRLFGMHMPKRLIVAPCHPMQVKARGSSSLKTQGIEVLGNWSGPTVQYDGSTITVREATPEEVQRWA